MPTSEARMIANKANAARSTGPKTPEGKQRSRANSLKHGLTGAGTVLPERAAAEVERRFLAFADELNPSGEVGLALVRRAATMSVRMECCVDHETAALTDRVRKAMAEFEAPEGADEAESARLRSEAVHLAMFDPSKEASLARKYEAAAERGFFRALKELRHVEAQAKANDPATDPADFREMLGSILNSEKDDAEFDALYAQAGFSDAPMPSRSGIPADFSPSGGRVDVPFTIGRRR